jgi:hypothetical protein
MRRSGSICLINHSEGFLSLVNLSISEPHLHLRAVQVSGRCCTEGFLGANVPKDLVENRCVHEYNPSGRFGECR